MCGGWEPMLHYALLQRHSHGRICLSKGNAKPLVKHSFFSFDLNFFFLLASSAVQACKQKKVFKYQLSAAKLLRSQSLTEEPRKNLFPYFSHHLFQFVVRSPDSGFLPTNVMGYFVVSGADLRRKRSERSC